MKAGVAVATFLMASGLMFAAPGPDDIALVNKYRDVDFDVGNSKPIQIYGGWKLYSLNGNITLWLNAVGNKIVHTPESVRIEVTFSEGEKYMRAFELPSGRTCTVGPDKHVEWGVTRETTPDFALDVLGSAGQKIKLSDLRGQVVLLDFWASWCQPCMDGLPGTEELYQKYMGRGLKVIGINIEGDAAKASQTAKSLGLSFPILLSEPDAQGGYDFSSVQITTFRIHAIPALFLIDKRGVVRKSGEMTDQDIEKLLDE
ncbi:MAG: TlpA disulfide reductase family protein [Spirochaetia bacterium]